MKDILAGFVLSYLRLFARLALTFNKPKIIGITGSVGKSSARNAIYAVLKDAYPTKVIEKGNSETGIPLGILGLSPIDYTPFDWLRLLFLSPFSIFYLKGTKYLVVEMGIDDPYPPKNMSYLLTIVKPDIAVFLNVCPVHTMQFEKTLKDKNIVDPNKKMNFLLEKIAEEKGKIVSQSGCKVAIYNRDDPNVCTQITSVNDNLKPKLLSFGQSKENDISYAGYEAELEGTRFEYHLKSDKITFQIKKYLLPKEYREIFAAAILAGVAVGLKPDKIAKALEKNFNLPKSRSSLFEGINNSIIVDSSYNASRAPVIAFLKMIYELKNKKNRPMVFIFGDMRELGEEAESEHRFVVNEIIKGVDYLYCVGPLTKKYVVDYLKQNREKSKIKEIKWFATAVAAGKYLQNNLPPNSLVLVKGSQNQIFLEEVIKFILKNEKDKINLCRQDKFWMRKKLELIATSSA